MSDEIFANPRLARVYDAFDDNREDLDAYLRLADDLGALHVVDVGCGTGTLAIMLAARGRTVTGIDPATASLDVARRKPGAEAVNWIRGDAQDLDLTGVDLITMTGNMVQAITDPDGWDAALNACSHALRPGGHLVFESRNPAFRAWEGWTADRTRLTRDIDGIGLVEQWFQLIDVDWPLVTFRGTWRFHDDGAVLTSMSTLRFRERGELESAVTSHGLEVVDVREAPDRPGREFVVIARRP
ncbi:class I SAM-dependent methyltransferase [Kineosporia sp. J2-2]|uniref:Class I SAM-dependent methyltransferase n=1 Tax=Kineosporia corallincola TaxID=2835133 RepID=A0ABS5TDA7_9ACTN|nr:class I SAM-dependent methyltransferase [Kineosporia corallincola]MBT0769026.1 class I SAM-dependent methyltransferase [Kineosporia corallincola]